MTEGNKYQVKLPTQPTLSVGKVYAIPSHLAMEDKRLFVRLMKWEGAYALVDRLCVQASGSTPLSISQLHNGDVVVVQKKGEENFPSCWQRALVIDKDKKKVYFIDSGKVDHLEDDDHIVPCSENLIRIVQQAFVFELDEDEQVFKRLDEMVKRCEENPLDLEILSTDDVKIDDETGLVCHTAVVRSFEVSTSYDLLLRNNC